MDEGGRSFYRLAAQHDAANDSPLDDGATESRRRAEPAKDKRFAGEAWSKDPRFNALARTYLAQTEQMRQALEAARLPGWVARAGLA